jgi:hypothetical protein
MLRFDFMPSDFHPLFLFLGEVGDLSALASLLRDFASHPRTIDVREEMPGSVSKRSLRLMPADEASGRYGMLRLGENAFEWRLNAWQAGQVAARIDGVSAPERKDGSEIVELGTVGEIPVKISRGEFTDDYLVTKY